MATGLCSEAPRSTVRRGHRRQVGLGRKAERSMLAAARWPTSSSRAPGTTAGSTRSKGLARCACRDFSRGRRSPKPRARAGDSLTRGLLKRRVEASDAAGTVVGEFEPRSVRRGGILRWGGQELALRPASSWRERYALADGDRELALFDGKGWGRRPVKVTVDEPGSIESGLLLLAAFVVRGLAEDAGSAAAGASTAATSGGS